MRFVQQRGFAKRICRCMSPCMRKYGSSGDACNSICHAYRYSRICICHAPWCAHLAPSWPQPATAGPRHPPASIPRSQADQTGAGTGGTAGTASPEPDVVEVEPSSKAKSMKWSEGRLVVLYAGPCTLLARSACVLWLGG